MIQEMMEQMLRVSPEAKSQQAGQEGQRSGLLRGKQSEVEISQEEDKVFASRPGEELSRNDRDGGCPDGEQAQPPGHQIDGVEA